VEDDALFLVSWERIKAFTIFTKTLLNTISNPKITLKTWDHYYFSGQPKRIAHRAHQYVRINYHPLPVVLVRGEVFTFGM